MLMQDTVCNADIREPKLVPPSLPRFYGRLTGPVVTAGAL